MSLKKPYDLNRIFKDSGYQLTENCIIVSTSGKEYRKISQVPKSEYLNIHTIKDIPPHYLKFDKFFDSIQHFFNLRFISCDYEEWTKLAKFPTLDKIAIFEKLSIFVILDYHTYTFVPIDVGKYMWENKITVFGSQVPFLKTTNSNIEYLNIINSQDIDYTNIPDTIQHLHLSIRKIINYKQTNLPIGLKSLTISIPEIYKSFSRLKIDDIITSNTKIPFGCELIIDNVFQSPE